MNMHENPSFQWEDNVLLTIKKIAAKHTVSKAVLFGSRARRDHEETSDYDVAIYGERLTLVDQAQILEETEEINTLKKIDVVFVDENMNEQLLKNIESEGIVIYEQTREQTDKF